MRERLRDIHEFVDRDEAEAARLLRGLGPAILPPGTEQRVYASLGVRRRLGPRIASVAAVGSATVIVMASVGAALAMSFHYGMRVAAPAAIAPPEPVLRPRAAVVPPQHAAPIWDPPTDFEASGLDSQTGGQAAALPTPARAGANPSSPERAEPQALPPSEPLPAPVVPRRRGPAPSAGPAAQAEVSSPAVDVTESTAARAATAPAEEASLVLAGLRALRREHDPIQAGVLVGRYLERFPQGSLVQEALAIAIEAGVAREDRRAAVRLAEQYLKHFPAGRFVGLARRVADRPRP